MLDCSHPAPADATPGDRVPCHVCPPSPRSNESQTVTWTVPPLRVVVARVAVCERCGAPVTHGPDCAPDCSAALCWPCLRDQLEADAR